jgi:DNA-binding transcriptional LysR family regulator
VTFQLRTAPRGSAGHLESIIADELDIAMVGTNDRPDGIRLHSLGSIRLHLVCAKRHRQETAVGLVRNGLGVALLPRSGSEEDELSIVEVRDADLGLPIAVATSSDRPSSAATAALLAGILRAAGRPVT